MSHHSACITTNGFKASDPSVSQAGHALKPMVLRYQSDVSSLGMQTNGFKASDPSVARGGHAFKPMVLRHQSDVSSLGMC